MSFEFGKDREEKVDKFLDTAGAYFAHQNFVPTGVFSTIGSIRDNLVELNANLKASNESSDNLTKALNRITLAGVIIAGLGVFVAIANFTLDFIKYINLN